MPWDRRFFKGREVWIETDADGEPLVEEGRVFMKYRDAPDAKIYQPREENVSESPENDRARWIERLEAREEELNERENALDVREQKLEQRERALEQWEEQLKQHAVLEGSSPGSESEPGGAPDFVDQLDPPEAGIVEFHTDGACSGNPGPCGFGVVMRRGEEYAEWREYLGKGTNNIAELRAIESALESVDDRSATVRIHSDSRYAIGVLTKDWNVNANRSLVERIRERLVDFEDVEIEKIEGHAGHPLNERADRLARQAIPDNP